MYRTQTHYSAQSFLAAHEGEHLHHDERSLLIERCIQHLIDTAYVSRPTAETITMQAYGERSSHGCRAYVDMSLTTSYTVFVRDPANGCMRIFTVSELLALCNTPALSSLPVPSAKDMLANGTTGDRTPL
ncbi:hypothetical protein [Paraburkholderia bryophila]|uniref:Uncharacterized protein n=1 Tax=Paraburkholderia bryophila TaxID=420952 RepID=A0A329B6N5_9BURK|nr:hypothetical protein [Paraburkholderia bryophila]RAS16053.1 hypothetical protein BX591_15110 [Paraburkholderia bryophila]